VERLFLFLLCCHFNPLTPQALLAALAALENVPQRPVKALRELAKPDA
jgi:hypothetical protein